MSDATTTGTEGELLYTGRLVPAGRVGNKVFARSLRRGEVDTGEGVTVNAGEELIILAGDLSIRASEIDAQSPPGLGGYAPVSNTVWTWYNIVSKPADFVRYLYSLARRLDVAHALWQSAIQQRDQAKSQGGFHRRQGFLMALSEAEVTVIALHRAMHMLLRFNSVFPIGLEIPDHLHGREKVIRDMRNAFEHIDERAQGKVHRAGKVDAEALTIFDQPDFVDSSILRYRGNELHFHDDVLAALLNCRELVMKVLHT